MNGLLKKEIAFFVLGLATLLVALRVLKIIDETDGDPTEGATRGDVLRVESKLDAFVADHNQFIAGINSGKGA